MTCTYVLRWLKRHCARAGASSNYGIGLATGGKNTFGMNVHTGTKGTPSAPWTCTHQASNGDPNSCGDYLTAWGTAWFPGSPFCRSAAAFGSDVPVIAGTPLPLLAASTSYGVTVCVWREPERGHAR